MTTGPRPPSEKAAVRAASWWRGWTAWKTWLSDIQVGEASFARVLDVLMHCLGERLNSCTSRLSEGTPHVGQPEASAAECYGNNERGDDPHGMSDRQNERNIDEPFAIHAAGEETNDKKWQKRQCEKAQGKQDCLSSKEPATKP